MHLSYEALSLLLSVVYEILKCAQASIKCLTTCCEQQFPILALKTPAKYVRRLLRPLPSFSHICKFLL